MKSTSSELGTGIKNKRQETVEDMHYRNIAGGLADEMMGFHPARRIPQVQPTLQDGHHRQVRDVGIRRQSEQAREGASFRISTHGRGLSFSCHCVAYGQLVRHTRIPDRARGAR